MSPCRARARCRPPPHGIDSVQHSICSADTLVQCMYVCLGVACMSNNLQTNEQNIEILRKKIQDVEMEKESDEKQLRERLEKVRADLDAAKNKTVPDWVSTVDVTTG